ncbi:MAG TPA: competence/damage-inducible protein A [Candidatus Limnocylindrales bacterium]|nr:competence/damage-inducible protein A [Candidatus Limnocylindrales bacterium]
MSEIVRTAAILSTGDEIVGGRTVDTNSSWIADRLASLGIDVVAILAVSDDVDRIQWAWESAIARADVVLSTGGLGPTSDDLTTQTVARVAGVDLSMDERQAERIREMFRARGRAMPENNLRQAMIPAGADVIDNPVGTAPGYRLRIGITGDAGVPMRADRGAAYGIVLPGVPREMTAMFEASVMPWLAERIEPGRVVVSRTFQTFGLPESALDEALEGAIPAGQGRLAFRASFPKISVRVSVAGNESTATANLDRLAAVVRERLGAAIYAEGDASMEEVVGELLTRAGRTIVTAESCTGGLLGSRLTDVAGSSAYYKGGLVAYSNSLKEHLLGVSRQTLQEHGAVSAETVAEMALGAAQRCRADLAVATSGIAGPGGGTPDRPVGTVAMALAWRTGGNEYDVDAKVYALWGSRDWIKILTTQVALDWVRRHLLGLPPLEPGQLSSRVRRGGRSQGDASVPPATSTSAASPDATTTGASIG